MASAMASSSRSVAFLRIDEALHSDPASIDAGLLDLLVSVPLTPVPLPKIYNERFFPCNESGSIAQCLFRHLQADLMDDHEVRYRLHWNHELSETPDLHYPPLSYAIGLGRAFSIAWSLRGSAMVRKRQRDQAIAYAWPYPISSEIIEFEEKFAREIHGICVQLWNAIRERFRMSFFHSRPTRNNRYAAAILFLTASKSIQEAMESAEQGNGSEFCGRGILIWYGPYRSYVSDQEWSWAELLEKFSATKYSLQHYWDGRRLCTYSDSIEVIKAMEYARKCILVDRWSEVLGESVQDARPTRCDLASGRIMSIELFQAHWRKSSGERRVTSPGGGKGDPVDYPQFRLSN